MRELKRGALIVLEGCDKAGKTTQIARLKDHLTANGQKVKVMRFPDLDNGTTLLVDRYAYSGVAFSVAKGLNLSWCKNSDVGLPQPDAVFFLDLPPKFAENRGGFGEERYEKVAFQNKVYEVYKELMDGNWQTLDASLPLETVTTELVQKCLQIINSGSSNKVNKLWEE